MDTHIKDITKISGSVLNLLVVFVLLMILVNVYNRGGIPFLHGIDKSSWIDADKKAITVTKEAPPPPPPADGDIDESFISSGTYTGAKMWEQV